jgi:hypothetical protein
MKMTFFWLVIVNQPDGLPVQQPTSPTCAIVAGEMCNDIQAPPIFSGPNALTPPISDLVVRDPSKERR